MKHSFELCPRSRADLNLGPLVHTSSMLTTGLAGCPSIKCGIHEHTYKKKWCQLYCCGDFTVDNVKVCDILHICYKLASLKKFYSHNLRNSCPLAEKKFVCIQISVGIHANGHVTETKCFFENANIQNCMSSPQLFCLF